MGCMESVIFGPHEPGRQGSICQSCPMAHTRMCHVAADPPCLPSLPLASLCGQIAEVERIVPTWREAAAACNGRQASDAKDGGGDGLEEDDGGVGGGRGGGGLGLGPSVSTFALEVEDPETCKTDLCYLASINDVKGVSREGFSLLPPASCLLTPPSSLFARRPSPRNPCCSARCAVHSSSSLLLLPSSPSWTS